MDVIDTNRAIENKIALLSQCRSQLQKRAEEKAKAIADYDKAIAICMLRMKNKQLMELDGQKIEDPPNTLVEKLAKGICWKERLDMEKADSLYKALISSMDSIQAEMNGLQSISRTSNIVNN
jgi:hypothetical protein